MRPERILSSLLLVSSIAGCSVVDAPVTPAGSAPPEVLSGTKADNYRSPYGREYDVLGEITIDLSARADAQSFEAAQQEAQGLKNRIASALNAELLRAWPEMRRTREANIVVMMRTESTGIGEVRGGEESGIWTVRFYAEMGAPNDFLDTYPLRKEDGRNYIDLTVPVAGADQRIALEITVSEEIKDAYPDYTAMMEDGRLDVFFHVGGDYNNPRTDVSHARTIYDDLVAQGFASPVDNFDALALDSGPLTSSMFGPDGQNVAINVTVVHPEMVPDDRLQELVDAYKNAAATADVVIYSGHAGTDTSYSGVVVHYNPRASLIANDFATIDLPTKYQIFVFNGCETYTGYADQLYRNPNKVPENLDVVTTVNYSWTGTQDQQFLRGLWRRYNQGFYPASWDTLLSRLEDYRGVTPSTIYGVHGIDDNAKITPTADIETVGASCTLDAECPGVDNLCVQVSEGNMRCGAACTSSVGCPQGTACYRVTGAAIGEIWQCLPGA